MDSFLGNTINSYYLEQLLSAKADQSVGVFKGTENKSNADVAIKIIKKQNNHSFIFDISADEYEYENTENSENNSIEDHFELYSEENEVIVSYFLEQIQGSKLNLSYSGSSLCQNSNLSIINMNEIVENNFIQVLDTFQDKDYYYIVSQFAEGGDLMAHLQNGSYGQYNDQVPDCEYYDNNMCSNLMSERAAKIIIYRVLRAIKYLHQTMKVIHGDIKPENILFISKTFDPTKSVLADFGLSSFISSSDSIVSTDNNRQSSENVLKCDNNTPIFYNNEQNQNETKMFDNLRNKNSIRISNTNNKRHKIKGTSFYAAPEVFRSLYKENDENSFSLFDDFNRTNDNDEDNGNEITEKIDVWSLGMTMYAMLANAFPFDPDDFISMFNSIQMGFPFLFDDEVWEIRSETAKNLIRAMLTVDVNNRISVDEALQHPWFIEEN